MTKRRGRRVSCRRCIATGLPWRTAGCGKSWPGSWAWRHRVFASAWQEHGKPHLAGDHGNAPLQFNLSHSGDRGLVGWARGRRLGVDIELWRPLGDEAALVRRFFSPAENAAL